MKCQNCDGKGFILGDRCRWCYGSGAFDPGRVLAVKKIILGENIEARLLGESLEISIDLTAAPYPSKTGRTAVIASTRGAVDVPGHALRIECYVYATAAPTVKP